MLKYKKLVIYVAAVLLLLGTIGYSYSFFSSAVIGTGKDNIVTAGTLSLLYEDGGKVEFKHMSPGDSVTKSFSVTNTGTLDTVYTIWWKELINEVLYDELVFSLECTSYEDGEVSGTCSGLVENPVGNDVSIPIKSNIEIKSGITHSYDLKITLKEMNKPQNYNQGRTFSGVVNIKEYFKNETTVPVLENYKLTNKTLTAKVVDTGLITSYAITSSSVESVENVEFKDVKNSEILSINENVDNYNIKLWVKNIAGNVMSKDLTPKPVVKINPNGGSWNGSTGEQTYNMTYNETMNISNPIKEGYTFNNWSVVGEESKLSGTTFTAGIENTTITANWTINEYTLTVNPNGGKYNNSTSNTTYTLDYKESQNISIPEREGYTFTGWSISSNKAQLSTNILTIGSENCTLTANWQANNYPWIAYHNKMNVNGSGYTLVDADTKSGEAEYGSKVTPSVNTYTGFTSPSSKEITIVVDTNPPVKNVVNYNYERNKYGLTINANGGTYSGNNPGELYYEEEITIANPNRTGYNFGGWTKSGGGTLTNTTFKGGSSTSTLTASWNPIESTVSFNVNGGSGSYSSITVEYDGTYGELPIPTRDGYEFLGWYTLATGGESITSDTKVSITSSQELFAQWKAKVYTLNLIKGTGVSSIVATGCTVVIEGSRYSCSYGVSVIVSAIASNGYTMNDILIGTNMPNQKNNQSFLMPEPTSGTTVSLEASASINMKLVDKILEDNVELSDASIDFAKSSDEDNSKGLYYTADSTVATYGEDGKKVYYFRGPVDNNWVSFGGYKWRIVRTTSEGGVKLIYAGDGLTESSGFIVSLIDYHTNNSLKYHVGYTFNENSYTGTQTNSNIKNVVDAWYTGGRTSNNECIIDYRYANCDFTNISSVLSQYQDYLSTTAAYCVDRSVESSKTMMNYVYYPKYDMVYKTKRPTFACPTTNASKYTVSSSTGNGYLTYPIALLSIDEAMYAGLSESTSTSSYLLDNASSDIWWTMSPGAFNNDNGAPFVFSVSDGGDLYDYSLTVESSVRPVISLKSCITVNGNGDGKFSTPYELSNSNC